MNILVVLTAKLIDTDMQSLLGKIPPILIPVERRVAIDYIYDNKDKYDEIIIITFEGKDKIKDYIINKNYRITTIELDQLRDIGYSVYSYFETIKNPDNIKNLSILFADTFLQNLNILDKDIVFYSETEDSERWTTFENNNDLIIYDKQDTPYKSSYNSFIGFFNFCHPTLLKKILKNEITISSTIDSFYRSLQKYYYDIKLEFFKVEDWLDLGHSDKYFETKKNIEARFFNTIEIDLGKGILKKQSTDKEKFINEILWFLKLPNQLQYLTPRIFSYSVSFEAPFIEMEYYPYNTLHEMFVFGNHSISKWKRILQKLLSVNEEFCKYKLELSPEQITHALRKIYYEKTIHRLELLKNNSSFADFFQNKIFINEKEYNSLNYYINNLDSWITKLNICKSKYFNIIHGDYFFANILYDTKYNIIKLIDPRGDFGQLGIYGDNRYELGKLSHSVDGKYDFIIEDQFFFDEKQNNVFNYKINSDNKHELIKDIFYQMIPKNVSHLEIKFIQGILFLSMIPLHTESNKRQKVMLGTGLKLIDDVIKNL